MRRNDSAGTGREGDESLAMLPEDLGIDTWLVVEPLDMPDGAEFDQVPIPGFILREKHEVVIRAPSAASLRCLRCFVAPAPFRNDICLHPDDGLDAGPSRLLVELKSPRKGPHDPSARRRASCSQRRPRQVVDAAGAVEKTVMRMIMEVDELWHGAQTLNVILEAVGKIRAGGTTYEHVVKWTSTGRNGEASPRGDQRRKRIVKRQSAVSPLQEKLSERSFISVISSIA